MYLMILVAAATMQPAAQAKTADIQVGAVKLRVPVPDGYCLPEGDQIAVAQLLASTDNDNVTLLTVNDCDAARADLNYRVIKAPLVMLQTPVERAELIEALKTEEAQSAAKEEATSGETDRETSQHLSELGGKEVSVKTSIELKGNDDICTYIGGLGFEEFAGQKITKNIAACMTAAGGRMITLYGYREGSDPEGYRKMLPELRSWALQIQPAP